MTSRLERSPVAETEPFSSAPGEASLQKKVLIVEDEGLIALDLKRRLERAGYLVTATASSAEDAIASARSERPDVVLMDIRLRGHRDGVEAAEELHRDLHLPVLFVTAHADQATLQRARLAEPFGYIVKPFTGTSFEPKIEMAIWKNAMEQRLRESERWLAETLRHAGDGIVTTDRDAAVATMNPAAELLVGVQANAARGREIWDFIILRDPATGALLTGAEALSLVNAGRTCTALLAGETAPQRTVECTIAANRDNGSTLGLIVVLRDITDRIRAAEHEKQIHKMRALSLLATGVGRELQEPLRTIASQTEECLHDAKEAPLRELRQIYRAMSQAQALVHQLVEMGRQESCGAETVEVNELIAHLRPRLNKLLARRQSLRLSLTAASTSVLVERQGLSDSLITLVSGAQQSAGSGGWVELSTFVNDKREICIAVSDSGSSIQPSSRSRVFEPYYHSRAHQADGLSLALVHHFVSVNNGAIETVQTEQGTNCFRLVFPTAPRPVAFREERVAER